MLPGPHAISSSGDESEQRQRRTNLFVFATLVAHGAAYRVKVRNISASGALIESASLPRMGADVTLSRGDIVLTGQVVWTRDNRAGLAFDGHAVVADWLPGHNTAQRAVDPERRLANAETRAELQPSFSVPLSRNTRNATKLAATAAMLESLADELAGDPDIVSKYVSKLQILDVASQALRRCASDLQQ